VRVCSFGASAATNGIDSAMSELTPNDIKYVLEKIAATDRRLTDWIDQTRRNLERESALLDQRLETMNEFRAQTLEDRAVYIRRDTYDARQHEIDLAFKALEDFVANLKGKLWIGGVIVAIVAPLVGVLVHTAITLLLTKAVK
jgi:hypothetical protein